MVECQPEQVEQDKGEEQKKGQKRVKILSAYFDDVYYPFIIEIPHPYKRDMIKKTKIPKYKGSEETQTK